MREAKDSGDVVGARLRAVLDGGTGSRTVPDEGPLGWADIVPAWSSEEDDVAPLGDSGIDGTVGPGGARPGGGSGASSREGPPRDAGEPAYPWDRTGASRPPPSVPFAPGVTALPADPSSGITVASAPPLAGAAAPGPRDGAGAVRGESSGAGLRGDGLRGDGLRDGFSGDGAFGSGAFGSGRRQWLHAFDPGRPGIRALGVVAVVVVLVAAFLTWRSRPRVDEVAPDVAGVVTVETGASGPVRSAGPGEVVVAVGGKVRRPGLVRLSPGARVADALSAAGGADPGVDVAALNLARRVTDGELIMVGVTPPPGSGTVAPTGASGAPGALVNLNTATLTELDGLPGVGPVLAQRILDARTAQGGFRGVSDLRKVDGIGESRYEQLKDLVTV